MEISELIKTKRALVNGKVETIPIGEHVGGKYDVQVEYANLITPVVRTPLEANRVFKTKAHMLAYINDQLLFDGSINIGEDGKPASSDDTIKSALPGIILTVINDEDSNNNGMYYIENTDPENTPGLSASKINITGPIPNEKIDLLFSEESGETGGTEVTEE